MGYNAEPGAIGNFPKLRVTINSTGVYSHCTKINFHICKLLLTLQSGSSGYCIVLFFVLFFPGGSAWFTAAPQEDHSPG